MWPSRMARSRVVRSRYGQDISVYSTISSYISVVESAFNILLHK